MLLSFSVASDSFKWLCIKAFDPFIIIFYAELDMGKCFYSSTCENPVFVAPLIEGAVFFSNICFCHRLK